MGEPEKRPSTKGMALVVRRVDRVVLHPVVSRAGNVAFLGGIVAVVVQWAMGVGVVTVLTAVLFAVGVVLMAAPPLRRWRRAGRRGALPTAERAAKSSDPADASKTTRTKPPAAQRPTRSESPRPTRDNKPRTALPTVPPPPPLPSGYPAPAELARKLRVLATEGDELPSNPTASSDTQAEVREERKRWAHKVKGALESAALSHHADWFFEAPELTISARNWLQSLGTAMAGGEEEIKSGWRLRNRLANLRRIIAQLEQASGQ